MIFVYECVQDGLKRYHAVRYTSPEGLIYVGSGDSAVLATEVMYPTAYRGRDLCDGNPTHHVFMSLFPENVYSTVVHYATL